MLSRIRTRDGVALPMALLGLVVVSLLVMSAIVTSGAELTVSSTHQKATSAIYEADGALERYVALKAAGGSGPLDVVVGDPLVEGHEIDVSRLRSREWESPDSMFQEQLYALLSRPTDQRGRKVGASVRTNRKAAKFVLTVDAGLTVGGDISVTGSSTISDGRNAVCDSAAAPNALQVSSGSTITKEGSATIEGTADTASYQKTEMITRLLGGMSLQEAIAYADIKFQAGEYSARSKSHDAGVPRDKTHKYNWGCPAGSDDACTTVEGNGDNLKYYPMVAIDAGGTKVVIEGDHAQGVLIIHNGSVEIRGNFVYRGIVVVEQDLTIEGSGGSGGVKIEGAVVSLGQNSTVTDNASGNATIVYNKCVTTAAQAAANENRLANAPQTFPSRTMNWFELIN